MFRFKANKKGVEGSRFVQKYDWLEQNNLSLSLRIHTHMHKQVNQTSKLNEPHLQSYFCCDQARRRRDTVALAADTAEVDKLAYILFSGFTNLVSAFPCSPLAPTARVRLSRRGVGGEGGGTWKPSTGLNQNSQHPFLKCPCLYCCLFPASTPA